MVQNLKSKHLSVCANPLFESNLFLHFRSTLNATPSGRKCASYTVQPRTNARKSALPLRTPVTEVQTIRFCVQSAVPERFRALTKNSCG